MKQKKLHIHTYGCHRISGKIVSILQMIIANAFGWQQIFQLQFKFQWSLFLWVSWQWFSIGSVMICHQTAIKPSHVLKMTQFTLWADSLLARFQSSWRTPNLVQSQLYKFSVLPNHWYQPQWTMCTHINGSAQCCSNSSVLAMVLLQFCPRPSITWWTVCVVSMDAKMTKNVSIQQSVLSQSHQNQTYIICIFWQMNWSRDQISEAATILLATEIVENFSM